MPADNTCVTLPGPWRHEKIQANGAQFNAAVAGHSAQVQAGAPLPASTARTGR